MVQLGLPKGLNQERRREAWSSLSIFWPWSGKGSSCHYSSQRSGSMAPPTWSKEAGPFKRTLPWDSGCFSSFFQLGQSLSIVHVVTNKSLSLEWQVLFISNHFCLKHLFKYSWENRHYFHFRDQNVRWFKYLYHVLPIWKYKNFCSQFKNEQDVAPRKHAAKINPVCLWPLVELMNILLSSVKKLSFRLRICDHLNASDTK